MMEKLTLMQKLDNFANPVLVREIRQYMRELAVSSAILLTVLTVFTAVMVSTGNSGAGLYRLLSIALALMLMIVSLTAGSRFAVERSGGDELLFLTTLSPWRIVLGKFAAVMAASVLIWFLFLPFFAAAWALRGVSMTSLAFAALEPMVWQPPFAAMVLMVASPKMRSGGRMAAPAGIALALILLRIGALPRIATVAELVSPLAAAAALTLVELSLAQAALVNPAGNRMPWPRLLGLVAVAVLTLISHWATTVLFASTAVIAGLLAVVGSCEPLETPRRALAESPHGLVPRIFHFLFAGGIASAWVYSLAMTALVWCAGKHGADNLQQYTGVFFYAVFYTTLCWIIRRAVPERGIFSRHPALVPSLVATSVIAGSIAVIEIAGGDPGILLFFSPLELSYNAECVRIGFISSLTLMAAAVLYSLPKAVAAAIKFKK